MSESAIQKAARLIHSCEQVARSVGTDGQANKDTLIGALKGQIRALCAANEAPASGFREHVTEYTFGTAKAVAHYEYTPGEPDCEDGPGCTGDVALMNLYIGGVDILQGLTSEQMQDIEQHLLEEHESSIRQGEPA